MKIKFLGIKIAQLKIAARHYRFIAGSLQTLKNFQCFFEVFFCIGSLKVFYHSVGKSKICTGNLGLILTLVDFMEFVKNTECFLVVPNGSCKDLFIIKSSQVIVNYRFFFRKNLFLQPIKTGQGLLIIIDSFFGFFIFLK